MIFMTNDPVTFVRKPGGSPGAMSFSLLELEGAGVESW